MDLTEKTALVTGANSGLGKAVARALAARGARVLMVARDSRRGEEALEELKVATGNDRLELLIADLKSQAQVRRLAKEVSEKAPTLDFLVNNAGTAFPKRCLTEDGIECTLAINHLAPFLLTNLLLDQLKAAAPSRIINVGTRINEAMELGDLNWEGRSFKMMRAYVESKLGMLHFTRQLAKQIKGTGVTVNCVFPGVFKSNLGGTDGAQGLFWKSVSLLVGWALAQPEQAAERVMYLIESPEVAEISGEYFGNCRIISLPTQARDPAANARVWEISERLANLDEA
ncbi:SDR family NAD(P)-dependent oxidoreductase [Lamprobacter modestohalophilus]|uniref:Short-chain dehydrogenase n=1 Tax=Lamprobacter modestohalophilus TaxID=1064514 RepID=A0A9X0W6L9_9GAMM|nr:SDR family NAD(P)-dependent oxidoreductase [Lamprobacter modestohalophilus]MBK1617842.1 short-chain dehydrogenase [Lamprobacter modestohalophilus]MCF7976925.1 SDR family NAD(P)-dependent oxidoreductase [Chromatiaceae bacterium]MCF7996520.1 SDR family NAD(P)-dependent oxidoreductase [Chromatiaceae bacterium]MEA1049736.1 SDR family NAD(P)-dependent oxidoreductase [Lamprobacter modestohalophilus]